MNFRSAIRDSLQNYRIWLFDAWLEIQGQFRRSTLGPLWISVNGIFFSIGVTLVFSQSSAIPFREYIFYIYTGIWVWQLIQAMIIQGSLSLINASSNLTNLPLHPLIYIIQNSVKQVIIWLFGFPLYVLLAFFTGQEVSWWIILGFFNLVIGLVSLSLVMVVVSYLCLIYRDIHQLIINIMQLMFFLTPIVWIPENSSRVSSILTTFNPISWILSGIREPLRFNSPGLVIEIKVCGLLLFSLVIAILGIKRLENSAKFV